MTIHDPKLVAPARGVVGELYIAGAWVKGEGEPLIVVNPGTEDVIGQFAGASAAQVESAIAAARKAYDSGVWSVLPAAERAEALRKLMAYLFSQRERLVELVVREAGCPVSSGSMQAQVHTPLQQGLDIIDLFLKLPEFEENPLPFAERVTARGGAIQSLRRYLPVGVVGAISAYNFPFYTNLWKVLPALITGNCVVLRPSPLTPLSALVFGEAAEAAGLPAGVLNVVADAGAAGGVALSTHADVDMVAFTGSTGVGKQVMVQGAATMKRLQLELGGKSAQIYLPDSVAGANLAAAQVCMAHAGQGCALGTRIFVPEADKAQAIEAMAAIVSRAVIGDPADPKTTMGPVISAAQRERCERYVALAVEAGAKVVCGGKRPETPARGYFFEPTILDTPDNKNPAAQEEIFGPVVSVIGYRDIDHLVEMANDSVYGLSGYVHGKDIKQAIAVASRLRTGTVNINGGLLSAYASSGGWKMSGIGRERGVEGLRVYQQIQAMNIMELKQVIEGLLKDKSVVITGAGSGLGRAAAELFAAHGAKLICADIALDNVEQTAAAVKAAGGQARAVRCDVSRKADVVAAVQAAVEAYGRLDVVYNNVGIPSPKTEKGTMAKLVENTEEQIAKLYAVNVNGVIFGCQAAVEQFRAQGGGGVIVNTASVAGLIGWGGSLYGSTKGAVVNLTRSLAIEVAAEGIRVNSVCPAGMATPFITGGRELPEAAVQKMSQGYPLGRMIEPVDTANAALFLASDLSSNITGVNLPVDGGISAGKPL